jgi:two-component system LytT family response regulator
MTQSAPAIEIRVLVADDEPLARRGLQQVLAAHEDCRVVGEARNGREALRAVRSLRPHVVLLDIQMPGLDGFQVIDALASGQPPLVVFVTAYDEFAVRAFEAQALDYLLKPVTQARFDVTMRRVRERVRSKEALEAGRRTLAFLRDRSDARRPRAGPFTGSIVVPTATGELVLDPEELDWIRAEDYYAAVHALGRRHLIRESLDSFEQRLDPAQFIRVHRSAIVRIDRIRELRVPDAAGAVVVLRDGTEVPVSRRRREQVASRIRRW